jgi:hypothetical protein
MSLVLDKRRNTVETNKSNAKEKIAESIKRQPDDATLEEIMRELLRTDD